MAIRDDCEVAQTEPGLTRPDDDAGARAVRPGSAPTRSRRSTRSCIADAATVRERADGTFEVLATGTNRVRLLSVDASGPFLTAELEPLAEEPGDEAGALAEGCCGPSGSTRSGWRGHASGR